MQTFPFWLTHCLQVRDNRIYVTNLDRFFLFADLG